MISIFYVFSIFLVFAYANPSIVWNVAEKEISSLDKLISKATDKEPVILFFFDEFNLAQFSKHASVYSNKAEGGSLKHLKNVIDSSKGYAVKEDDIDKDILTKDFVTIFDPTKNNADLSKSRVIIVYVNTWTELDTLPVAVIQRLGHNNYIAILTDGVVQTGRHKRQAPPKPKEKNLYANMTFINNTHCLLFSRRVIFHVRNMSELNKPEIYTYTLPQFIPYNSTEKLATSDCSNYSKSFTLDWSPKASFGPHNLTLQSLKLVLNLKLNKALGWWGVDKMDISAKGSVIEKGQFDRSFNGSEVEGYIEGPMLFSYACGQQKPFYFFFPSEVKDESPKIKYGISFDQLQIQPFQLKGRGKTMLFTDDVYDCVPFISIAVWMFLVCAAILLIIVFCGISMISSLKTMDRFDDPKGKNLVVNVKE